MVSKKKVSIFALDALDLMKVIDGNRYTLLFIYGGSTPSTGQCPVRFRTKGSFLKRGESDLIDMKGNSDFHFD